VARIRQGFAVHRLVRELVLYIAAAVVSRVKKLPSMTASSSSNTSSSNGAIPNEVVCEEEELDFDKWRVRHSCLDEHYRCSMLSLAIAYTFGCCLRTSARH